MPYSTAAQVRQALVPTSDGSVPEVPTHTAADYSSAQLEQAVTEADAMIDDHLRRRYQVPVAQTPVPAPLPFWSRDIAAYLATLSFRGSLDFTDNDPIYRRYSIALNALKAVMKGDMALDLPPAEGGGAGVPGAGAPVNPYTGDLWRPRDFDIFGDEWPHTVRHG
ncbi:MAG: phage protein Gp36 family protein [Nocardioidaceae bacterium]